MDRRWLDARAAQEREAVRHLHPSRRCQLCNEPWPCRTARPLTR
jgi:hypothetical protein